MPVPKGCKPRADVLQGDLNDKIFAADFGEVLDEVAPDVYSDPGKFFKNTHPAQHLVKVIGAVFGRLASPKESGAAIRLSTGFGGGKTHTLLALWHLARNIDDPGMGTELLPAAGRPKKVCVVAVDAAKAGTKTFRSHGKNSTCSLWGELAFQLGGEKALKSLGKLDDPESQPEEAVFEKLFPASPVLILLDELVVYMATLSEQAQGNLLAFLTKIASIAGRRPQTVLVVTDPADQRAFAKEAGMIGDKLSPVAIKLDDLFGRKLSDFDPIGNETAKVIVRRLFEKVDERAAQAASATYHALYERVSRENPNSLAPGAATKAYAQKFVDCYPFHPRLLETAQGRLAGLQEFNKSRGTLRLFARILRTVAESESELELITAGDVDWSSPRIQADLLQRLNRDPFKASIVADIEKHAAELDGGAMRGIHVRVASALLLESIPLSSNSGLEPPDLTLAILRPDEAGPEPAEALNRLIGVCWHTYPMPGGRGWQFRYEPNIIKQVEERTGQVSREDAKSRVHAEAQQYFGGPIFGAPKSWPKNAKQVPESKELQLVLCDDESLAKSVCSNADDADPKAPIPRGFQNAIVAVAPTISALNNAIERAQRLLAAEKIEKEHSKGEGGKIVREQLSLLMPELRKHFSLSTYRAFDRVVLAGGHSYPIEEQFQGTDAEMLAKPQGQACLAKFLDAKGLIYKGKENEALDPDRFVSAILPGATPLPDSPGVWTARAIHERFLGAQGLRLIRDGAIVRQSLLKAVEVGRILIKLEDGRVYDEGGCVEGPPGARRRTDSILTTVTLDDTVQVARAGSPVVGLWTKVDEFKPGDPKKPPVPPAPQVPDLLEATTWTELLDLAAKRPIRTLALTASKPAAAAVLSTLAMPLGAEKLALTVTVGGSLKDGGSIQLNANGLKPTHPTKPLSIAQTFFNAIGEHAEYEAVLDLTFGEKGRSGLEAQLKKLAADSPEEVSPRAQFGRPSGGGK